MKAAKPWVLVSLPGTDNSSERCPASFLTSSPGDRTEPSGPWAFAVVVRIVRDQLRSAET